MRSASSRTHSLDGTLGCLRPLQTSQFLFDKSGRGPFAAGLDARKQVAFEVFPIIHEALEIVIVGIGFRHEIEQIESAAGCSG
jgi:hypothetical protein